MNLFELWATLGLDTSEFDSKIKGATQQGQTMADSFRRNYGTGSGSVPSTVQRGLNTLSVFTGNILSNMAVGGVQKLGELLTGSIDAASDLQEVQNVVDVTFGDSADVINKWAEESKRSYGIGETAAKRYNGTMGAMLKSMGTADADAVKMSTALTGLAGDMASFYNLDHEEAFNKIRSGISGETEPLKQLGINMSVANLEAFALAQGIKKSYDKMSEAEKVQLRYEYLMQATADAQGDFSRTAGEYANQSRLLSENIATLQTNIGEFLLPVLNDAISFVNRLFAGPETDELTSALQELQTESQGVADAVKGISDEYVASVADIESRAKVAEGYLATIAELSGKATLTEEESQRLLTAAEGIERLYGVEVLDENNALTKTHKELQKIISDMDEIARKKALGNVVAKYEEQVGKLAEQELEATALIAKTEEQQRAVTETAERAQALLDKFSESGMLAEIGAEYGDIIGKHANLSQYYQYDPASGTYRLGEDYAAGSDAGLDIINPLRSDIDTAKAEAERLQGIIDGANAQIEAARAAAEVLRQDVEALTTVYTSMVTANEKTTKSSKNAQKEVGELTSAVEAVPENKTITFTVDTVFSGAKSVFDMLKLPKKAVGLDYVPYNDYPASLHEGEAVLTKIEAEDWRRSRAGVGGDAAGGVSVVVNIGTASMRDERDIKTLAREIADYTRRENHGVGTRA